MSDHHTLGAASTATGEHDVGKVCRLQQRQVWQQHQGSAGSVDSIIKQQHLCTVCGVAAVEAAG